MELVRSICIGILAAALMAGCTSLMMEIGILLMIISAIALALATYPLKTATPRWAITCGIGFAAPIVVTCIGAAVLAKERAVDFGIVAVFIAVLSPLVMCVRAKNPQVPTTDSPRNSSKPKDHE